MTSRTLMYKVIRFPSTYRPLRVIALDIWIWILTWIYRIQKLVRRFPILAKIAALSLSLMREAISPLFAGILISTILYRLFVG